jgi:LPXTG-motif cell wall-anchored protein
LSQQELNSLINSNKTSAPTNKSKDDNNNALAIGLVAAFALIVGLVIGLVVKRKKRN